MSVFPQGEYAMRVEEIGELVESERAPYYYCKVRLRILGTEHDVYWFISESPNAEWVWRDAIDSFGDRHKLLNRVFLFRLEHAVYDGQIRERVRLLHELPSGERPTVVPEA